MRTRHIIAILLVLAIVGIVGFSAPSFAGWGRGGGGNCPMAGGGYGPGGAGPGAGADLTDEEIAALQKERNAFFEQTRDLRDSSTRKGSSSGPRWPSRARMPRRLPSFRRKSPGWKANSPRKPWTNGSGIHKENPKLCG